MASNLSLEFSTIIKSYQNLFRESNNDLIKKNHISLRLRSFPPGPCASVLIGELAGNVIVIHFEFFHPVII